MAVYPRLDTLQRPGVVMARRGRPGNPPVGSDSFLHPDRRRFSPGLDDRYVLAEMEESVRLAHQEPTSGKRWPKVDPVSGEILEFTGTPTLKPEWMREPGKPGAYFRTEETLAVLGELRQGRWPRTARRERIAEEIEQALHLDAEVERARALGGPGAPEAVTPAPEPEFLRTSGESRPRVKVDFGRQLFTTRPRSPFKGTIAHVNPRRPPIRYSQLTEAQRRAVVEAYTRARQFTPDPLHAAAIAAREVLVRDDREWNSARGSDAFGAAVAVLAYRKAMQVNPAGRPSRAQYCPEQLADPGRFDPRSFRTVQTDGHRVTIGCPKGQYDARRRRCRVGTRAQRILHPAGEGKCPVGGLELGRRNPLTRAEADQVLLSAAGARTMLEQPAISRHPFSRGLYTGKAQAYDDVAVRFARFGAGRRGSNPDPRPVEIYGRVEFIGARKGQGSQYSGERFLHRFRRPARILGLPDGRLLLEPVARR